MRRTTKLGLQQFFTLATAALLTPGSMALAQEAEHPSGSYSHSELPGLAAANVPVDRIASPHDTLLLDEPGDGNVWARGSNWKASFGPDGFEYIPFLGSDAPQNYPVRFTLDSVTVAGEAVPTGHSPSPELSGRTVTLDRGSLREVYHLALDTVEQTFVFDALPAAGDLRLHLAVETELVARPDDAGWKFMNERGHVAYGAATAVDAEGRTAPLVEAWVNGGLEIVVPSAFLESATFPLTVDPVFATFRGEDDSDNQIAVDIAYDVANDTYIMVYEEAFSVTDRDIISRFYSPSVGLSFIRQPIDITSTRWSDPSVGNCYFQETFLCTATVGAVLGSRQIRGRTRSATDGQTGSQFSIAGGFSDNASADVGGYSNDFDSEYSFIVVFQRSTSTVTQSDIISQGVTHLGTLEGPAVSIANISGQTDRNPSISQNSGPIELLAAEHEYMVVWERVESPTNRDIWARTLGQENTLAGRPRFRAYSFSDAINPDVSAQEADSDVSSVPIYVIVFERLVGTDNDIFAVVANNGDADNARNLTTMQSVDINDEQREPHITYEGQDYFVVYGSEAPGSGFDNYMTVVNIVSDGTELRTGLSERRNRLGFSSGRSGPSAITTDYGSTQQNGPWATAIWIDDGTNGSDGDVRGAIMEDNARQVIGSQYCNTNENVSGERAWLTARSVSQNNIATVVLEASDLPMQQFGLFLVAPGNNFTPNPGGSVGNLCLSGGIGRFNGSVVNSGLNGETGIAFNSATTPGPNGPFAIQPGQTWNFQLWTRDIQNGVATSNYTNAVAVTFL